MKKVLFLLSVLFTFLISGVSGFAEEASYEANADHAIAIEASTGKILYEKNATEVTEVANMSKLLTVYLVYEAVENGDIDWDTKVPVSEYAYNLTVESLVSNVPMENSRYTVKELLEAALIANASSPTIALAEKIAGSEEKFVNLMRAKLEEWGITDATIVNATGLSNSDLGDNIYPGTSESDENKMSALSLAKVASHLVTDYPEVLKITGQLTGEFDGNEMNNYNTLLEGALYEYPGVDGLLTGTSEVGGSGFVSTGDINDMRIITVILGANSDSSDSRFTETVYLLNHVITNFYMQTIIEEGEEYGNHSAKIVDGKKKSVKLQTAENFNVVLPIDIGNETLDVSFSTNDEGTVAPIEEGQALGTLTYNDEKLIGSGYIDDLPTADMVATTKVKKSFFLKVWWNHFVNYVNEYL